MTRLEKMLNAAVEHSGGKMRASYEKNREAEGDGVVLIAHTNGVAGVGYLRVDEFADHLPSSSERVTHTRMRKARDLIKLCADDSRLTPVVLFDRADNGHIGYIAAAVPLPAPTALDCAAFEHDAATVATPEALDAQLSRLDADEIPYLVIPCRPDEPETLSKGFETASKFPGAIIELFFDQYDDDSRQIWQIPEARTLLLDYFGDRPAAVLRLNDLSQVLVLTCVDPAQDGYFSSGNPIIPELLAINPQFNAKQLFDDFFETAKEMAS